MITVLDLYKCLTDNTTLLIYYESKSSDVPDISYRVDSLPISLMNCHVLKISPNDSTSIVIVIDK